MTSVIAKTSPVLMIAITRRRLRHCQPRNAANSMAETLLAVALECRVTASVDRQLQLGREDPDYGPGDLVDPPGDHDCLARRQPVDSGLGHLVNGHPHDPRQGVFGLFF